MSLELGGKTPNVVLRRRRPADRVDGALWGIYYNMGQDCTAGSRLFVQKGAYDEILNGLVEGAKELKVGPGLDEETDIGPLVTKEQTERVLGYLVRRQGRGPHPRRRRPRARCRATRTATSCSRPSSPTPATTRAWPRRRSSARSSSPCRSPTRTSSCARPTTRSTASAPPSGARDAKRAHRVAHKLKAGTVWVNCYGAVDPAMPFGGYKESGHGREMGQYAIDLYTEVKAVFSNLDD